MYVGKYTLYTYIAYIASLSAFLRSFLERGSNPFLSQVQRALSESALGDQVSSGFGAYADPNIYLVKA